MLAPELSNRLEHRASDTRDRRTLYEGGASAFPSALQEQGPPGPLSPKPTGRALLARCTRWTVGEDVLPRPGYGRGRHGAQPHRRAWTPLGRSSRAGEWPTCGPSAALSEEIVAAGGA